MSRPIEILLVDDHILVLETLRHQIDSEPDMHVIATAPNADDAIRLALDHKPTLALLDISMSGRDAFDASNVIRTRCPETRIIILSGYIQDRYIDAAIRVGASAYLMKTESWAAVRNAIRTVAGGGTCFSPEVEERIVFDTSGIRLQVDPKSRSAGLTEQQIRVLCHLANGVSKREVAQIMNLSESTIGRHCDNLMTHLDIHNRAQLTRFAIREGFIEA